MKRLIRGAIYTYRLFISPILAWLSGPGGGCRFEPSCSEYFLQAVDKHGSLRGSVLGLRRICRCHPWGGYGFDPVPNSCSSVLSAACGEADGLGTHQKSASGATK